MSMFNNTKYVTIKRTRFKSISGDINLPYNTEVELIDNFLSLDGKKLCLITSSNAHTFFAINKDGRGQERGKLRSDIINTLTNRDDNYQNRWDKIWSDELCAKYKRHEHKDYWLWNHDFYEAPIEDLEYIFNLITK